MVEALWVLRERRCHIAEGGSNERGAARDDFEQLLWETIVAKIRIFITDDGDVQGRVNRRDAR